MAYKNLEKKREYNRKYNKEYYQRPSVRKRQKKYLKEYMKKWRRKNKKCVLLYNRGYYKNNKDKVLAQRKAQSLVKLGSNCLFCNTIKDLQRHHPNYNESLRVNTLCRQCHYNLHNYLKIG